MQCNSDLVVSLERRGGLATSLIRLAEYVLLVLPFLAPVRDINVLIAVAVEKAVTIIAGPRPMETSVTVVLPQVLTDSGPGACRYRRLALMYHPDKTDDPNGASKFWSIAEAFHVLDRKSTKAVYDQYGSQGLSVGVPVGDAGYSQPYAFPGDPLKIFKEFFGGTNPFSELFPPLDEFGVVKEIAPRTRKVQNPPLVQPLRVSHF